VIERAHHLLALERLLQQFPVVAILGTRQVGKTTLARQLLARSSGPGILFDLEDPADLARLTNPMLVLRKLQGLVVLDEIQRRPEIFPILRVLADRPEIPARFLVLGSASQDLLQQSSESLAGRIAFHDLEGFTLAEVGEDALRTLWLRGGLPRSFLAPSDAISADWRDQFVRTFLERDLAQLGIQIPAATLRRFWTMIAHYHGQIWNSSELGRAFGVSDTTVARYRDVLTGALVVRQLTPWHENLQKRQVKSPKVYIIDSGLLHTLLNLETFDDLASHPKVGASWEGFGLAEVIARLGARSRECFFWATHGGAELDLLVVRGRRRLGFEFKYSDAPQMTRSMHTALADLKLDSLDVVHAGEHTFPLHEKVRALALSRLNEDLAPLG
jgi:predicted AAA+ superfamily ATPase